MQNYCVKPPFITQSVPPMVMFEVGRDHKLYYEAYNDGVDLDGDGRIDRTYDHSIEYYGYFNPYKCYTPSSGSASGDYFTPVATNTDRFCSSGQWGGNILNWMAMSRMDVLRKVMYGGQRSAETPRILLNRAYIPQDAHSWGKEYTGKLCYNSTSGAYKTMCYADSDCDTGYTCTDKSENLMGMVKPTGGDVCSGKTISWGTATQGEKKLLVVRYPNAAGRTGTDHNDIMNAFDTTQFYSGFNPQYVTDFGDAIFKPSNNHGDKYAQVIVSEFYVAAGEGGTWAFAIDSDDGSELILKTTSAAIVNPTSTTATSPWIAYYGSHGEAGNQSHYGTYTLAENTWYRMIVRQAENTGDDGVRVWFVKGPDTSKTYDKWSWKYYGNRTSTPTLTVRAPDIVVGNNDCTLKTANFILNGTPENTGVASSPQSRHLVCNTTLSDGGVPILRLLKDSNHRIWEWASKERPVCDETFTDGSPATTNRTDYTVQVEVCKAGVGTLSMDDRFERCRSYGGTFDVSTRTYSGGSYVPVGLFQKYGEVEFDDAGDEVKVCSKSMGKTCNGDNDCGDGEGLCFTKAPMYFGLFTTSYTKNTSGGVLRKNPGPVFDEVNNNDGKMQTSENERGNLITSLNRMKVIDFDYGDHAYDNCGWITNRAMYQGTDETKVECKMWGNPIAEMMYESLRYFAGKGTTDGGGATPEFDYSTTADSGLSLSKPKWGYNKGSVYYKPFEIYPTCSQPFMLILSDVNTSFDADQIPGSLYAKPDGTFFAEDAATPQLGLGTVTDGKSLLNQLTDYIGQIEGVNGNGWFIGESGGSTDFICSAKTVANLSAARGMCPEEPTKLGSYYAAALAYYGKTQFSAKTGYGALSTFVVAMSSPFADIKVKAGSGYVNVVPFGKSVYGGGVDKCLDSATSGCTLTTDASGSKKITGCSSTPGASFCPTNSLVDFYMDDMKYDASNNIIYAKFRINFEDVEQGADHDMDAIASYELCTQAAATANYGSCTGTISGLQIKVKSEYAAGGIAQLLGFIVSGTTEDGPYLVIKDVDTGDGAISGLPIEWNKTFSVSGSTTGNYLKNPLWYAAKWGGFTGSTYPQTTDQWDKNSDGTPDTYFPVSNPLQLDEQLEKALNAILTRVASGTAASILNSSEGSGASLLQAVFYPKKPFDDGTEASWIGEMQNLWFYLDPYLQSTSIRVDTVADNKLSLLQDYVAAFYFDTNQSQTLVRLLKDTTGNGSTLTLIGNSFSPDDTTNVKSLWRAGRKLWSRNLSTLDRKILTRTGLATFDAASTGLSLFDVSLQADPTIQTYLQAADTTEAGKIIQYIRGIDQPDYRNRTVTIINNTTGVHESGTWRLGDIINSTPKIQANAGLNSYDKSSPTGYADGSYDKFISSNDYKNRGMVYVGANDGMLHAFRMGVLQELTDPCRATGANPATCAADKAQINNYDTISTSPVLNSRNGVNAGTKATTGDDLGREEWAFIPSHMLPYLKYLADPDYPHLFYVDGPSLVIDASINKNSDCTQTNYWDCAKQTRFRTDYGTNNLDLTKTSWRTILIGSTGTGGASRNSTATCTTDPGTNCVKTPVDGLGYSTYFALDVTNPNHPKYLWEFAGDKNEFGVATNGNLGFATSGPVIVRTGEKDKNGRWFAVFGSGPTGPIDITSHQFMGYSDQNLKLFVVDLATGSLVRTIDTGIAKAFAGSLSNGAIDTDRSKPWFEGYYKDDALYLGYVQYFEGTTKVDYDGETDKTWTRGGVYRVITKEDSNPANWVGSTVIDGIGPVTTAIAKLQDRSSGKLWLYFGTGRYFYKLPTGTDDPDNQRRLYGIQEPCYQGNDISPSCTTAYAGTIKDQTTTIDEVLGVTDNGWYVDLDAKSGNDSAERLITDPVASPAGAVFFTTFKPTNDVCSFGGTSFIWAVDYATGGVPRSSAMAGKVMIQVSTGAFAEVSLSSQMQAKGGRRSTDGIQGVPPKAQGLSLMSPPKPVKKILQIHEK
ncbi:MAG: pilus assembly protein PilY [Trichlorobacter sp.]